MFGRASPFVFRPTPAEPLETELTLGSSSDSFCRLVWPFVEAESRTSSPCLACLLFHSVELRGINRLAARFVTSFSLGIISRSWVALRMSLPIRSTNLMARIRWPFRPLILNSASFSSIRGIDTSPPYCRARSRVKGLLVTSRWFLRSRAQAGVLVHVGFSLRDRH